ncbi:TPA: hypothetical protein ACQZB3_000543 [Escherichia coli]
MPTVPTYNSRQTVDQGLPAPQVSVQTNPDTFGAGLGEVGTRIAGIFAQEQHKANVAQTQDAVLQFQSFADDQFNNTDSGLYTKQGKNAVGQSEAVLNNIRGKADELAQQVPEAMRRDFMQQINQAGQQYKRQASTYEIGQVRQYEEGQFKALQESTVTAAQGQYNDPQAFTSTVKQGFTAIDQFAEAHGWSDEERANAKNQLKERSADGALSAAANQNYMDFIAANGEPGDYDGAVRVSGSTGDARGLRNNNPGNIEAGQNNWEGQTGSDGRFAKFVTPEHGIRALGKNLLAYGDKGFDTVNEIVNRWAPASDGNNTTAYVKALCEQLSVKPDDQLNLSDLNVLKKLSAGIVKHENGSIPYSDSQLDTGLRAALGLTALDSPKRYTGNVAFDAASTQAQASYLRQAKSLQGEARTQLKAQLTDVISDAKASYLKGVEYPNPPSQAQLISAYGYREGNQRFADLENQRVAGQYIGSFRNMPSSSITSYVADLKTQLGTGEGFAGRADAFDHVEAAAKQVISLRESNPYQAALDMGAYKPIASTNPADITSEIKNRTAATEQLKSLGINAPILSKEEAATISERVRGTTDVNQSIGLLQSFGRGLQPQALRSVAASIAPDSAATAYSALILGTDDNQYNNRSPSIPYSQFVAYKPTMNKYEVAKTILQGDQLINPTKAQKDAGISAVKLPADDKLKQTFDDEIGNAFSHNPQARQMAWSIYKSAYAGLAYTSGHSDGVNTKSVDSDIAEKAIQMATGGVIKGFNGGDVVMPFGMDKTTFKDRYTEAAGDALKSAGLNPASQSNFVPVNVGDSQYRLVTGSGRWATDPKTGAPITVRVQ